VAYITANRSEGKLNFMKLQQSCITSLLTQFIPFFALKSDIQWQKFSWFYWEWTDTRLTPRTGRGASPSVP